MNSITIIGLGPGDAGLITRAAWQAIEAAGVLYLRTAIHPTVAELPPHVEQRSFDHLYQSAERFGEVYARIAEDLVARAEQGEAVRYAVPGHPLVAESTTRRVLQLARERGVATRIIAGLSFVEPACELLELDPLAHGLQLVDALDFVPRFELSGLSAQFDGADQHATRNAQNSAEPSWASLHGHEYEPALVPYPLAPTRPALICQVYSRAVASHVKLSLMERYPAEHPVTVVRAAGVAGEERAWSVPLHELDHQDAIDHLTSVFVPALDPLANLRGPEGVDAVVARLMGPGGCPWDREQSPQSLRATMLEECHEVLEALDAGDDELLAEELGDLLLNILMQAEMGRQAGSFSMADVYEQIGAKLIRRHPHVFGDVAVDGSGQVLANWEQIKRGERAAKGKEQRGPLDGIPPDLPALATAQKLTSRAAKAGFDSPELEHAWDLLREELDELRAAGPEELESELGDALLAAAKLGWKLGVDAESALRSAGARFRRRFDAMEQRLKSEGRALADLSIDEKLAVWDAVKYEA